MEDREVIELLRHYRHDNLNDLQLVMGYLQLGKPEKAQSKINEIIEKANRERQLDRLQIPKTMLWIYKKNWFSENVSLDYHIDMDDRTVSLSDDLLKQRLERIFADLSAFRKEFEHYHAVLVIQNGPQLQLSIEGEWMNQGTLIEKLRDNKYLDNVQVREDKQLQLKWTE
ncbi:Spo0B domain-containing protein [Gracilibacillus xinjiangensis]|uniref:Spo0B domain-containing protein n=1 Tax=Gracilibacillus xinjiangensis TaxID=1193282 RepID=A0ABV8WZE9_9BACI